MNNLEVLKQKCRLGTASNEITWEEEIIEAQGGGGGGGGCGAGVVAFKAFVQSSKYHKGGLE